MNPLLLLDRRGLNLTKGRTESSKELTPSEAKRIMDGIDAKLRARMTESEPQDNLDVWPPEVSDNIPFGGE